MPIFSRESRLRQQSTETLRLALSIPLLVFSLSCRPSKIFYVVEDIRVPAVQTLQKFASPVSGQNCLTLAGETHCQQYPLRPAQKNALRFLVLAPPGAQPVTLQLTKLKRTQLVQPLPADAACKLINDASLGQFDIEVPLATLGLSTTPASRTVVQETPIRIEEHVIAFDSPASEVLNGEFSQMGTLPLFKLEYVATSGALTADTGVLTFPVVAQPTSSETPTQSCLSRLLTGNGSPITNTPPSISALSPARGEVVAGSPVTLQMTLSGGDTDPSAKQRVQWYLSRGELDNQRAAKAELTFSGSEPLTAVGIVRDLQGGIDFAWTTFSARQ
ncbi:hypothetical protein EBU99_04895 [bacterium]|nr:hypothetical protein [bacterium]